MKRDFIFGVAFISIMVGLIVSCTPKINGEQQDDMNNQLIVVDQNTDVNVIEIKDEETGVHYLKTNNGVTVMYNSDGTIKVTD